MKHYILVIVLSSLVFLSCGYSRFSKTQLKKMRVITARDLSERAQSRFMRHDYVKAIQIYQLIISKKGVSVKSKAWARYEIGFCYYYMKDFKAASLNFNRVLQDYPEKENLPARILSKKLLIKIKKGKTQGI
ncbi:MAG: tetratricopeptide repeat protein [Spirochaetes bacterium]|nr:tetratricopeptide repeat protein [Spirochaetota bacterium]